MLQPPHTNPRLPGLPVHAPNPLHPPAPAWARDQFAIALAVLLSMAVLWFGGGAAQQLAVLGVVGSVRTHAAAGSLAPASGAADYSVVFDLVVAPQRTDAGATVRSIRIEMRDLLPLAWGKGWI